MRHVLPTSRFEVYTERLLATYAANMRALIDATWCDETPLHRWLHERVATLREQVRNSTANAEARANEFVAEEVRFQRCEVRARALMDQVIKDAIDAALYKGIVEAFHAKLEAAINPRAPVIHLEIARSYS